MKLGGLQKMTLLDYPGHVACTVFTVGCNLRCPFCHNASLALGDGKNYSESDEEEFFNFLSKRRGILDGVAITGGEPLLHNDIIPFMKRIREMGFLIKLDTNGTNPVLLSEIVRNGLCDMIAMDIKNAPDKYPAVCGLPDMKTEKIRQSVEILMAGKVPFEFRTTVVAEFHEKEDFVKIGEWIRGNEPYYLQYFVDSGELMESGWHPPTKEQMQQYLETVRPYLPNAAIRGAS